MEKKYNIDFRFYNIDFINQAINDFKDISEIKIKENNLIIKGENEEEIEEIFNEFMNYVIGLMD